MSGATRVHPLRTKRTLPSSGSSVATQRHLSPGIYIPNAYSMFEQRFLQGEWTLTFPGIGNTPIPGDGVVSELDFWITNPDPQRNDNWQPFLLFEIDFYRFNDGARNSLINGFTWNSNDGSNFDLGISFSDAFLQDFNNWYTFRGDTVPEVSPPTPVVFWDSGSKPYKLDVPGLTITRNSSPDWWRSPLYFINNGLADGFTETPYDQTYAKNYGLPNPNFFPGGGGFNDSVIILAGGTEEGYVVTLEADSNVPAGLTVEPGGAIVGTPTQYSTSSTEWTFHVLGQDSSGAQVADFYRMYTFQGPRPSAPIIDQVTDVSFRLTATYFNYDTFSNNFSGQEFLYDTYTNKSYSLGVGNNASTPGQSFGSLEETLIFPMSNGVGLDDLRGHECVVYLTQEQNMFGTWGVSRPFGNIQFPVSAPFLFGEAPPGNPTISEFNVYTSTPPNPISVSFSGDSDLYYVLLSLPNQSDFQFFSFTGGGPEAYNYELTGAPSGGTLTQTNLFDFFGDPRGNNPSLSPILGGADTTQPSVWGNFVDPLWIAGFKQTGAIQTDSFGRQWRLPTTTPGETWEFSYDNLTTLLSPTDFAGQPIDVVVIGITLPGFANWSDPVTWNGVGSTLDLFLARMGNSGQSDQALFYNTLDGDQVTMVGREFGNQQLLPSDLTIWNRGLDGLLVALIQTYNVTYDLIQGGPSTVNNFGDYLWDARPSPDCFVTPVTATPSGSIQTTNSTQAQWTLVTVNPALSLFGSAVNDPGHVDNNVVAVLTCPANTINMSGSPPPDYISSQGGGVPTSGIIRTQRQQNVAYASGFFLRANPSTKPPALPDPVFDEKLPPVLGLTASPGQSFTRLHRS